MARRFYVALEEVCLYLATAIGLYDWKKVIGISMSNRMKAVLVNKALLMPIWQRKLSKRLIQHTDQSSQCTPERS